MTAPTWLRDHLIRTGAMTEKGTTRRARYRHCRCGLVILTGLTDPHTCAIEAHVDPHPLNPLGEALALLEGRYTVTARPEAGRFVLDDRDDLTIAARPAGTTLRADVLAEHRCGRPVPKGGRGPSSFHAAHAAPLPTDPPF